jgi:amino acid adenylation domain-containing protein/non-ribosomal peptide synthase protein (TIGR01720 family)
MTDSARALARLDPKRRALLARRLRERGFDLARLPILPRDRSRDPVPLSFAQERLWILDRIDPGSAAAYAEPYTAALAGEVAAPALAAALTELVRRHEALRTTFPERDGGPVQLVGPPAPQPLPRVDLRALPAAARQAARDRLLADEARRPFALAAGPLVRARLVHLADGGGGGDAAGEGEHLLVLNLHHIVCDATSLRVVAGELGRLYAAARRGAPSPLPAPPIQYADFSEWQREWLAAGALDRQLGYWRDRLAGAPTLLEPPGDRPRPPLRSGRGGARRFALGAASARGLRELARGEGATPFMILLAAFQVLLARHTGRRRLLVGTPVANRQRPELAELVGFLVNTLVLDADLAGDPSFRDHLRAVRDAALEAFAHQDLPFARLVEELRPERAPNATPLVQVMLIVQRREAAGAGDPERAGFALRRLDNGTAKFDLTLILDEGEEGIDGQIDYDADLFEASTVDRLAARFATLVEGVVADPDRPVGALPLLPPDERRQALAEARGDEAPWPAVRGVHELFEERAARDPGSPAVIAVAAGGDSRSALTYGELERRSARLARRLRRLGVGPDVPVVLCADRSAAAIVGLLAVLRAGGAYVPLDPELPAERFARLAEETGATVRLAAGDAARRLPPFGGTTVTIDDDAGGDEEGSAPPPAVSPDQLAYVIFTSGSTGRPKGVLVPHRGLINLCAAFQAHHGLLPGDRLLMVPPLAFDASAGDVFPVLALGAALVLHPNPAALSGADLVALCRAHGIGVVDAPVALWSQWVEDLAARGEAGLEEVFRAFMVGGESLPLERVRTWERLTAGRVPLFNHYGPTEATVCATSCRLGGARPARRDKTAAPIGRPLDNVSAYLLDRRGLPVPPGVPGEVALGGAGVARGYRGRPAATAERFVPDPFAERPGARLYRTGDLARRVPGGELEFLGRTDQQLKIRGVRIEPAEVEHVLAEHPAVAEAGVVARDDGPGGRWLVAYLVPAAGARPAAGELRALLRGRLPEAMVPGAYVAVPALPLTANGKLDRGALPPPGGEGTLALSEPYVAPASDLERRIAEVWRELLGVGEVGVADNFFDLGGNSLLLLRAQGRLSAALGREVPTVELFRHPTVAELAAFLAGGEAAEPAPRAAPAIVAARPAETDGAVAIVAMVGRFPGAADVEEFWRSLCDGVEAIRFFTDEELLAAGTPPELLADPSFVKAMGVVDDIESFDAAFFGVSPREAQAMDPQHRLFLETAWHALEEAGYDPETYPGRIGVFAGVGANTYQQRNVLSNPDLVRALGTVQIAIGSEKDFLTTRASYKFNLRGPSFVVQTACSTSLVAAHLAASSLRERASDLALAGGVTLPVPQRAGYLYHEGGIFSPDGHCRAFDLEARGTVPGSGVGIVVLKRLADARADGDPIRAVIKGSAINNDGSQKVGYTAPSVRGQVEVLRAALERAGADPATIGYIETHGTGTLLGDLIEATALKEAFAPYTDRRGRCALGSVKTNIGHADTAAGVAGLIKAALAVERGKIPPSLHFRAPNEKIHLAQSPFFVAAELGDWPLAGGPRRAGVSSFGIGGTNAHVVLEQPPERAPAGPGRDLQLLLVSARTPAALERATAGLARHLADHPQLAPADVAFTLHAGRRAWEHRRAVVCRDLPGAAAALAALDPAWCTTGARPVARPREAVFLFPGGGAQFPGMGRDLYRSEESFRAEIDRSAELLRPHLDLDLRDLLYPAPERAAEAAARLERTTLALPALFATEYALARLLASWGIEPAAMIGHSLGEYPAACLAGVLSLPDALALVALRGRLFDTLPEGAMLSVPLPERELARRLGDRLSIAALNLPSFSVASGPVDEIAALEEALRGEGLDCRRVPIAVAAHSQMVEPILAELTAFVRGLTLSEPRVPYLSNVTGTWVEPGQVTRPEYWAEHLRGTVRFADGLAELLRTPDRVLLEVGPGRTLATLAGRHPDRDPGHEVATAMRHPDDEVDDRQALLAALGTLWTAGLSLDAAAFYAGQGRRRVRLPGYPFERTRYWIEPGAAANAAGPAAPARRTAAADWFYLASWRRSLAPAAPPPATAPERWLIFAAPDGLGSRLAERLAAGGRSALVAVPGRSLGRRDGVATLDPERPRHYRELLAGLASAGELPDVVVHLGTLREADAAPAGADGFERAQAAGFYPLLHLHRALAEVAGAADGGTTSRWAPRLAVVVSGAFAVEPGEAAARPAAATAVAAGELFRRPPLAAACTVFDVAPPEPGSAAEGALADRLIAELSGGRPAGGAVALREGRRWVRDYVHERLAPGPPRLRPAGTYLVTGGTGSLGLDLAAALAAAAERPRLVLAGPTSLPPQRGWDDWLSTHPPDDPQSRDIRRLRALTDAGAELLLVAEDATDPAAARAVVAAARRRFGAVHGLVHAGGEPRLADLGEDGAADCERHFRPVAHGLEAVAAALAGEPLDFALLVSSLPAALGAAPSVAYGAAHAYLEAEALRRSRAGSTPWWAVLWDGPRRAPVEEGADAGGADQAEPGLAPPEGGRALAAVLGLAEGAALAVSTVDLPARLAAWRAAAAGRGAPADGRRAPALFPRPALDTPYVAPSDPVERKLAEIWEELLGVAPVGVHDNFLALGGDSVLGIQLVAKARRAEVELTQRAIYLHPTIAELALAARTTPGLHAQQGLVVGPVPLSPIQRWFFDLDLADPHHWNLPVALEVGAGADRAALLRAAEHLAVHHDALRLRFRRDATGAWRQAGEPPGGPRAAAFVDFRALPAAARERAIAAACARLQGGFDLAAGPLFRAVLVARGAGRPDLLLLLFHHLVIDVVSMGFLLEDLEAGHRQLRTGRAIELPLKTTSFSHWAGRMVEQAAAESWAAEIPYWLDPAREGAPAVPLDRPDGANTETSVRDVVRELTAAETDALLREVAAFFGVEIRALLLAALALAWRDWTGAERLLVEIEGHGREPIFPEVDLSRSVGWFTLAYPLLLDLGGRREPEAVVAAVRAQLDAVPGKGIGYGVLRYLGGHPEAAAALGARPEPQLNFLYLGQFSRPPSGALLRPAAVPTGPAHAPRQRRSLVLEITARVDDGRLTVAWVYSDRLHHRATIERFADGFVAAVGGLIAGARAAPAVSA